jgi:hypothetical protein
MGKLQFDPTIRILNADNTVTERLMNLNGGYYDMDVPVYGEDADEDGSISFGAGEDGDNDAGDAKEYLDARENEDDPNGEDLSGYLDTGGYVSVLFSLASQNESGENDSPPFLFFAGSLPSFQL